MEQLQTSLHCQIHKQPAYFLLFRNNNNNNSKNTKPANPSVIKCSICIVKEKIKGDDLIALPEIMNPTTKQFSSDVSHLGDELDGKIKYIHMHSDSPDGINHVRENISKFFIEFRKELEAKLNESEKLALIAADKISENQAQIFKKHEEMVSKNDLQEIIEKYTSNDSNSGANSDYLQLNEDLKAFFENQQKNQQTNESILRDLLQKFEKEKSSFSCFQPNLQKERILDYVKQINFFVESNGHQEKADEDREKEDFVRYFAGNTEMVADIFTETARIMLHHPVDLKQFQRPAFKAIGMVNRDDSETSSESDDQSNQSNSENNNYSESRRRQVEGEEDIEGVEDNQQDDSRSNNSYSSSISNRDNEGSSSNLKTIYTLLDENTRFVKNYGGEEITSIEDEQVQQLHRIINSQTASQKLLSLASLLRSFPQYAITAALNNNARPVEFDMLKSKIELSRKISIIRNEQNQIKIHNRSQGRIVAYSDFILNPKLKYLMVVDVISNSKNAYQYIGLTSDDSKDTKWLHLQNHVFGKKKICYFEQRIKGKYFSQLLAEELRYSLEIQICLEKQHFIVSDYPKRQNINSIAKLEIDLSNKYRLGVELSQYDDSVNIQSLHVVDFFRDL